MSRAFREQISDRGKNARPLVFLFSFFFSLFSSCQGFQIVKFLRVDVFLVNLPIAGGVVHYTCQSNERRSKRAPTLFYYLFSSVDNYYFKKKAESLDLSRSTSFKSHNVHLRSGQLAQRQCAKVHRVREKRGAMFDERLSCRVRSVTAPSGVGGTESGYAAPRVARQGDVLLFKLFKSSGKGQESRGGVRRRFVRRRPSVLH